jgi:uncharacterized protein
MQSQERELITGLFGRLQQFEAQPRDPEAESLIAASVARQPAAPYLLAQTVLVQEQALNAAQERISELEAKVNAAPAAATSFLGSAPKIGPWGSQAGGVSPVKTAPASVPSTRSPLQAAVAPQQAGGGFLRTAMATAAGVAGGALLFEGIRGMMGHNPGSTAQAGTPSGAMPDAQQQVMLPGEDATVAEPGDEDYDTAAYESDLGDSDDSFA